MATRCEQYGVASLIDYGSDYLKDLVVRSVRSLVLLESTENITHLHLNIGTRRGYGKKNMSLAISEPTAGYVVVFPSLLIKFRKTYINIHRSDVANLQTTAKREGDHYVINGVKKWITGGMVADFFTCAVRTGGPGMGGLSLILIPKTAKGLRVRKMKTQCDSSISTRCSCVCVILNTHS